MAADRDTIPVRSSTVTTERNHLADWRTACGVTTGAMESTGVYWLPLYEILEARRLDVGRVNAHHVKNAPGRTTDVMDGQWLQELPRAGGRRSSVRPPAAISALGAYLGHRETLVQSAAPHVHRMPKALVQDLELFDTYQREVAACDAAIEAHVLALAAQAPAAASPLPAPRTKNKPRHHEPRFDIRTPLHQLTGVASPGETIAAPFQLAPPEATPLHAGALHRAVARGRSARPLCRHAFSGAPRRRRPRPSPESGNM